MKKLFTCSFLISFLVSGLASISAEQAKEDFSSLPPAEAAKKIIESNDLDKDGKLSKKEVNKSFRLRRFKTVDTNKDGLLDEAELETSYSNAAKYTQQASNQSSGK
ncbi:MAG: hypothetical protein SFU25_02610 [Candidatus Caenarcaniphilales bacterium]|nr:hypothetical protein [Candidatus Caenarcaniphilales bacterium]